MRTFAKVLVGLALSAFVPATAHAQASIAGQVRDTSGALLPGVTVEAASPVLIEKVRTVVTDSTGLYRVVDLRPGTYAVTFTLPGFATVLREGIVLTGSFTATINIELKVGALAETVTVTGESPIVDVQSATKQAVLDSEILAAVPTTRSLDGLMRLVPGVTAGSANAVSPGSGCCTFNIHGGRTWEGRMQIDGIDTGSTRSGLSGYVANTGNSQEVVMTTSGASAESEQGGPVINVVQKTGGNTVHGNLFGNGTWKALQGNNFTDALRASVRTPADNIKQWDTDAALGGPLRKDRLWYFGIARYTTFEQTIPGVFYNTNAGNPNAVTYVPDLNIPARSIYDRESYALRLTWQATPRNKFSAFWDEQPQCINSGWTRDSRSDQDGKACRQPRAGVVYGGSATAGLAGSIASPEAQAQQYDATPQRVYQASWTSPVSNKLLVQSGFGAYNVQWGGRERPGNVTRNIPQMTELGGAIPGLTYGSGPWADNWMGMYKWQASASYITGAHSLKVGYQDAFLKDDLTGWPGTPVTNDLRLAYTFSPAGNVHSITEYILYLTRLRTRTPTLYVQDQWTRDRLTLSGGLRYDHVTSYSPAQGTIPGDRFLPNPIFFPQTDTILGYNDITPRVSAVYDVFGTGKTSIKINLGKYLEQAATTSAVSNATNPLTRIATATNRTWTDANGDRVLNCPNLETTSGATGECGAIQTPNFGTSTYSTGLDPALQQGWGMRGWDWGFGASVQHEVLPRVSVEVGYNRRWFGNFLATDNRALANTQFTQFSVPVAADPRLPNSGGYTVTGLYDPTSNPIADNLTQLASNFGNRTEYWQGVDVNVNARLRGGITFQGGTSTGQTTADSCEVRDALPESAPTNPFCHTAAGYLTQFKGLGAYTIPRVDLQVSSTFTSSPGAALAANYSVTAGQTTLGRPFATGVTKSVNLINPGDLYGDRINQLDFRVGKILRFGSTKMTVSGDVYNSLNSSAVTSYNQTYDPNATTWLTPTGVLSARFVKFGAQFEF